MSGGHVKIGAEHLERQCVVYVRQSTLAQSRNNPESLERQCELVGRAQQLGWPRERVRVVDADLGMTGAQGGARDPLPELVADGAGRPIEHQVMMAHVEHPRKAARPEVLRGLWERFEIP